ncbi:MAG: glycosyltransferase family 1 protein, partial [Pseudolysinimonas sp.]
VIHSDSPALIEVAADAGIVIPRDDPDEADGYASAIREVLGDDELRARLSLAARDRARAFSWRDSAEKVWQLHADL